MVEEAENSLKMSACGETTPPLLPPQQPKKKRNLPGMPDPDAEVVALSPKTLLATNRFVCEICGKGFQRDQNLQLHRRGHNLPWKLKQRSSKEPRKRVYVCPEPSCVHHNASRALGDLTGIKKHFSRKHGEKKWKCERCSKKYAVQSDWKAHMKTCGTREYKCDCGTLFSRRDSFITHREFCDVLAEESVRQQGNNNAMVMIKSVVASPPPPPLTPSTTVVSPGLSVQSSELAENPIGVALSSPVPAATPTTTSNSTNSGNSMISTIFASSSAMSQQPSSSFSSMMSTIPLPTRQVVLEPPPSLSLSSSLYLSNSNNNNPCPSSFYAHNHQSPVQPPAMSATALLQKAAQMGAAATSNASFLCSLGLPENNNGTGSVHQWDVVKQEHNSNVAAGQLGLGLHHSVDGMMGSSSIFGSKPTTLDFLGLGMGSSALLNSYGGGFHVGAAAVAAAAAAAEAFGGGVIGSSTSEETWDGSTAAERNEAA